MGRLGVGLDPHLLAELAERYRDWHDRRSASMPPAERERLRSLWRDFGRGWGCYAQILFLIQPDVQTAMGEAECARLIRHLRKVHDQHLREAPSHAWVDAWGLLKPPLSELPRQPQGRKHGVRLRRRRPKRRGGAIVLPAGRWTPPQCHAEETMIDELEWTAMPMDEVARVLATWPTSQSGLIMQRIAAARMHEERWKGRENVPGTGTVEGEI